MWVENEKTITFVLPEDYDMWQSFLRCNDLHGWWYDETKTRATYSKRWSYQIKGKEPVDEEDHEYIQMVEGWDHHPYDDDGYFSDYDTMYGKDNSEVCDTEDSLETES